ncbi:MAG: glycosyltransferase family 39 protein, partial [Actinobacteria bacterium]|nr:glycosyltransferase family 39 protein [Actinomycetota bacterium]
IDKPVLFHWVQGAAFCLFGRTELAARLPSGLGALVLLSLTYWCGKRLFGRPTATRATLFLATTPATFALSSIGLVDMLFAVCLFGTLASLIVGWLEQRPRLQYLGFALLAAAVLTKGPVAIVLFAVAGALCLLHPVTRHAIMALPWVTGVGIVIGLGLPWFVWMGCRFGQEFVDLYLLYNNLSLFGQPLYRRHRYPFYYGRVFLTAFLPWSPIVIAYVLDVARRGTHTRAEPSLGEVVLGAWVAAVVGFFSASWFKVDTYIFPAAPAVCLLASHAWQQLRDDGPLRAVRVSLLVIATVVVAIGMALGLHLFHLNLPVPRAAVLLPLALVLAGLAFGGQLLTARGRPPMYGWVLIGGLLCGYATIVALGFPILARTRPTPNIARWIVTSTSSETPIAMYRLRRWKASLRFYAGRPVATLDIPDDVRRFFGENPDGYCVMTERDFEGLRDAGFSLRIVYRRAAVVGTEGRGFRRQRWGGVVVSTRGR